METKELQDALVAYTENLRDVELLLESGEATAELQEIKAELEEAIQLTYAALGSAASIQVSPSTEAAEQLDITYSQAAGGYQVAETSGRPAALRSHEGASSSKGEGGHESGPAQPNAKRQRTGQTDSTAQQTNNSRIHPCNAYAEAEPDFAALAGLYDQLRPHVRLRADGSGSIDFTDPDACRELTRALLRHDFGIVWDLPPGQLVPPVTNRANYLHWLHDLLELSRPPGDGPIRGLDIGCGANLIYPLLGAAMYGWQFLGVDVTGVALHWARRNAEANPQLAPLLEVRESGSGEDYREQGVLRPAVRAGERFAFCMCNPPFFESMEEAGRNPSTAFSGTAEEMVCPGGELGFVGAMVADSAVLRGAVHWYSAMLGRKASLRVLRAELLRHRVTALRTTEFAQGRTSRWGIAWSFTADPSAASRPLPRPATTSAAAPAAANAAQNAAKKKMAASRLPARRRVTFDVRGRRGSAVKLLQALEGFLVTTGAACTVKPQEFTIDATLPAAGASLQTADVGPVTGGETAIGPAMPGPSTAGAAAAMPVSGVIAVRVAVFQQNAALFSVTASVPSDTPEALAARFSQVMADMQADMCQVLV